MEQIKWFERSFDCLFGAEYLPGLIERLRDTTILLNEKINEIPESILVKQINGKWSVKQNIGHLTTLEPLWRQRIKDICDGRDTLTPADLDNTETENANFNEINSKKLLLNFRKERVHLISLMENLPECDLEKQSLHPRLKQSMRVSDLAFFIAEHDNHHLTLINHILFKLTE